MKELEMNKIMILKYKTPFFHQYPISYQEFDLELPKYTEILHAHEQDKNIYFWASTPFEYKETEIRKFFFIGTGVCFPTLPERKISKYLGTAHVDGFVFHYFEIENAPRFGDYY